MLKQVLSPLLFLLIWNGASFAQTQPDAAATGASSAMDQALASRTCELPKIADTAPLEQVKDSDLMVVPVAINGQAEKFLLDIGLKRQTAISPELMAKLALPEPAYVGQQYGGDGAASGVTGFGGFMHVRICDILSGLGCNQKMRASVGSFTIGHATGHHLQFAVAAKGEIGRSASYDGFLTGDYLQKYDVELDFAGKQMTWLTPTSCTDPNQVVFWAHDEVAVLPVSLAKDGRLQMQAMVGGHVINAEIDTGSARSVMRRDIAELYVGLKSGKDMTPVDGLEDGMHMQIYVHTFPEIIFAGGSVTAVNVPVLIQDYSLIPAISRDLNTHLRGIAGGGLQADRIPDLVIGMDVLKHLHMYVVPGQAKVYVTAAD